MQEKLAKKENLAGTVLAECESELEQELAGRGGQDDDSRSATSI